MALSRNLKNNPKRYKQRMLKQILSGSTGILQDLNARYLFKQVKVIILFVNPITWNECQVCIIIFRLLARTQHKQGTTSKDFELNMVEDESFERL
mmetsp:Transcript_19295/g.28546  ORF Transcript_19295/g.28546 Transcript_19295/m.28546 type:complete len:95 (-) Transcript_19295:36-320(-)